MNAHADNGYISGCLIHWMGKDGDVCGAEILSVISSSLCLLLSYNPLRKLDRYNEMH
jgi:hypothetical protein